MKSDTNTDPPSGGLSEAKRRLLEERLRGGKARSPDPSTAIPPRDPGAPLLASPGQQWIFVAQKSMPTAGGLTLTSSFEIEGSLDLDALERAVGRVIDRHPVLRSTYRLLGSEVEMVQGEAAPFRLDREACEDPGERKTRAESFARQPFDLENGPLLRVLHLENRQGPSLLVLAVHDIVFDGWSLGLFWSETTALYRAERAADSPVLPELPIRYADFAAWQRRRLDEGRFAAQLDYWKARLRDPPPPIALPVDRPYPSVLTIGGRLEIQPLKAGLTEKLKGLAASENASLFMVALLAFQILLHKTTGANDIVVGSPIANRRRRETAPLIGFFLSTVALRVRFETDPAVRQALRQVRDTTLEAIEHQDVPFNRVVEAVRPVRVSGRHPLCQVMFVYQTRSEAAPSFSPGDAATKPARIETGTSKFDLTLFAAETGTEMEIILEYRTDLFDPETIRRMMVWYERILEEMVGNPDRRISEIGWLDPEEIQVLLRGWQGPALPAPPFAPVSDQIAIHARNAPDAPAVIGRALSLTRERLDRLAGAIAERLRSAGAGPGTHVGHLTDRSPEAIAAILGILRTGAAYVPVDPDYPEERRRLILGDAGITILVTDRADRALRTSVPHCIVIEDVPTDSPSADAAPFAIPGPDSPAYLIYTSGSTGRPKGVVVTQANLLHSTDARLDAYGSGPQRFLLVPSFSFDSSVAGLFWTLAHGGTLVIPDSADLRDPLLLREIIRDRKVTDMLCVPTLYREILREGSADLRSLRRVIVAGESCPHDLVAAHFRLLPETELFNEYGPTEATVWATVHRCTEADAAGTSPVPIGRPIARMQALVLDDNSAPLPPGVPGELYLGGPGLARGYWGRGDLTAERFVERELPLNGRCRLYRTGDKARWRPDGVLEFLGRLDDQLKIRGYRIEAGEIEATLRQHPLIEDCVVVASGPGRTGSGHDRLLDELASGRISADVLDRILGEVTTLTPDQADWAVSHEGSPERAGPERFVERDRFRLELKSKAPDFVAPPRKAQRNWLLGQAMEEFADDLAFIDEAAPSFVPGYNHQLGSDLRDVTQSTLTDQEIMEDWQTPLMRAMARCVTGSHGDILEIGFGRGVSAEFIQEQGVRSHTVVEPNRHSIDHYFSPWRQRHASRDIRLIEGRWQEVEDQLGLYDGIFFHAFPLNEEEFTRYVLESITFAEHAFAPMAAHLRPGGAFTYLTTEINSLSRRHQRCLFRHFRSISIQVEKLSIPPDTHDTWWADQMVVIRAEK